MKFPFSILALLLILATSALPLRAQLALLPDPPKRSTVWGEQMDRALREALAQPALAVVVHGAEPAAPKQWQHPLEATDFEPAGTRDVPERLAGNLQRNDHRQISLGIGRDILGAVETSAGFRRNNLAYALTLALTVSLNMTDLRRFDANQEERLLRTVNDALANSVAFQTCNASQRTMAYDALIVTAGLISRMTDEAITNKDRELAEAALTLAKETLASFGIAR